MGWNLKSQLRGISKNRREWCLGLGVFFIAWVLAAVVAYWAVTSGHGHWLELFNGATWPPQFVSGEGAAGSSDRSLTFYAVLGLRTVLNLGVVFTAVLAISAFYLVSSGQFKEWIMSKLNSVLATRDIAMAAYLERALLTQCKVELSEEQRAELYKAAEAFHATAAGKAFQKSSLEAVGKVPQPSV